MNKRRIKPQDRTRTLKYYYRHRKGILAKKKKDRKINPAKYRDYKRRSYLKNKIKLNEYSREYHKTHPEILVKIRENRKQSPKYKENNRKYYLKAAYNLTICEVNEMEKQQKGCCALCRKPFGKRGFYIDHNHKTGLVRGLLCSLCNIFLGRIDDSTVIIKSIVKYLNQKRIKMPVHRTTIDGQPAFQWGTTGKKYIYKAGNAASRLKAKKKAIKQGLAVARRTGTTPEL